jgi:hypothetical protein
MMTMGCNHLGYWLDIPPLYTMDDESRRQNMMDSNLPNKQTTDQMNKLFTYVSHGTRCK